MSELVSQSVSQSVSHVLIANLLQMDGGKGVSAVGGSGVEELVETGNAPSIGGGRKKKKKHKSGEESSSSAKSVVVDEELADTVLPMISDNQGSYHCGLLVVLCPSL